MLSGVEVTNWETAKKAADLISQRGVEVVVLTLGSMGALVKENNLFTQVEAVSVNALDTTAAGDTFCGAFCVGLSEGMSVVDSVSFANKASAISVTRMGAQASIPYRKEVLF